LDHLFFTSIRSPFKGNKPSIHTEAVEDGGGGYGIEDLSLQTVDRLQEAYQQLQKPGFYRLILQEKAGIETCLVNQWPILESEMPDLLKTDLFVSGMIDGAGSSMYSQPAGISGTDHV